MPYDSDTLFRSSPQAPFRSSPRKRGPSLRPWIPALGIGPKVGDGFIQSLPVFVGERGLDQSFERCAGIAAPEQTRDHDHELVELGLPAFMSLAVAFDQASHARDLHVERIIRARGRRHQD